MERVFGAHLSSAGGYGAALLRAEELKINCFQLHAAPPQRWKTSLFTAGVEDEYLEQHRRLPEIKLFFHGIYLINLGSPREELQHSSVASLVSYLDLISRMNGEGVVFHLGSFKDEDDLDRGFDRVIKNVDLALSRSPANSRLLLEVSAGAGKIIGSRLEELARVYDGVKQKDRVGFALDTQHMWASGYDYVSDCEGFVSELKSVLTIDKIWAIHVNDSKTALASKRDVHANIGEGTIGREGIGRLINHPELRHIPLILETPGLKLPETTAQEVEALRSLLTAGR